MPVQIGSKESDFSNPLGLLSDCHRRIERFLDVLIRISDQRKGAALTPSEREALEKALKYFRNSAPKHTADEEDSLFPRLKATGAGKSALDCLAALESDHKIAAEEHAIVDRLGEVWLQHGLLEEHQASEMTQALARLSVTYKQHIAIEDTELFPLAARVLAREQLAEVGQEMAQRRGAGRGIDFRLNQKMKI